MKKRKKPFIFKAVRNIPAAFHNRFPCNLPGEIVQHPAEQALLGKPLSYAEAEVFCRTGQIRKMQNSIAFKSVDLLSAPRRRIAAGYTARCNKSRPAK